MLSLMPLTAFDDDANGVLNMVDLRQVGRLRPPLFGQPCRCPLARQPAVAGRRTRRRTRAIAGRTVDVELGGMAAK